MLVYYFVPFIASNRYLLFWVSNGHNSVTVQNRTHVYMNFFHHKDLGNHLLQLCPKILKHPVYIYVCMFILFWFFCGFILEALEWWRLRHYVPLKHWELNTWWCGIHSRRTEISTTLKEHSAFIFKVKCYCWTYFKISRNPYPLTQCHVTEDLTA